MNPHDVSVYGEASFVVIFPDGSKWELSWDGGVVDTYDEGAIGGTMWLTPLDTE